MIHALRERQPWMTYCGLSIEKRRGADFKTVAGAAALFTVPAAIDERCKSCATAIAVARWRRQVAERKL